MQRIFILIFFFTQSATILLAQPLKDTTVNIKVNGACIMCKERIENAMKIKGIKKAVWDIPTHMLTVVYDESRI